MIDMDFRVLLDLVIACLLIATIGYAITLNNRLTALRRNRDQMAKIIASFNEATVRAESSIPKLRRAADEAGGGLQERVEKAQSLRDDLAFMIERADTMANRLENAVRNARTEVRTPQPVAAAAGSGSAPRAQWSGSGPSPGAAAPMPIAPAIGPVFGRSAQQATVSAIGDEDDSDERSEAERELLRALQSMR